MKNIKDHRTGETRIRVLSPQTKKRGNAPSDGAQDVDQKVLAMLVRVGRAAIGSSQTELGKRVGITQRAIHQIERGTVRARKSTMNNILDALHEKGIRFEKLPDGGLQVILPAKLFSGRSS